MNTETQTREWLYALAASKLSKGELRGSRPSLVEIEQWRTGTLQPGRDDEVLSHVAHDEGCFAQWRDLCDEQRWLDQQQIEENQLIDQPRPMTPSGAESKVAPEVVQGKSWLGAVAGRLSLFGQPLWGGAAAAALFALVLLPAVFLSSDDAVFQTYQQQLTLAGEGLGSEFPAVLARSTKAVQALDSRELNQDKLQFRMGLAAAASHVSTVDDSRWDAWRATLPEPIRCENSDSPACGAEAVRNQALGSWSLVTALACNRGDVDAAFWRQQATALEGLASDITAKAQHTKHFLAARLKKPLPQSRESLCITANGLLGQGG